jgi:hypothetical protein
VVAGRDDTGHDYCIDEASGSFGACHLEDDGKGRGRSFLGGKALGVVGDVEANQEDREDVKE